MKTNDTRRPEATSFTVQGLVERAKDGLLRVPDWQRLFKWRPKHISQLLDSITKGYPVGTLLLWKRPQPAPAGRVELGPLVLDASESTDAQWVIDGRQRVTTLAGVLLRRGPPDRPPDARDQFTWAFDLQKDTWVNPKPNEAWKPVWLPADRLVDATDLITWIIAHQDVLTPAQALRANSLARDVREFEIPAIVVHADSDETLRVIFDRTNNAGKRLEVSETFDALQGALSPEQPSTIRALARIPIDLGFGPLDKDWLLRLVVQVGGGDMTKVSHETLERKGLAAELPRTAAALQRALVFVRSNVGIPNEVLLPYRLPLVILSVFFDKHPEPRPRSLDLLARWVWRGAETGRHRGQDIGEVRTTFAAIDQDEEMSVQRLLSLVPERKPGPWEWRPLNLRSASTRIEILALLSLAPRDLETGRVLDAPALLERERSKALTRIAGDLDPGSVEPWSHLATRLLHPVAPKKKLLGAMSIASLEVAASHAVSPEGLERLRSGDVKGFLLARNQSIIQAFRRFMDARTRWSETSRASIKQLTFEEVA